MASSTFVYYHFHIALFSLLSWTVSCDILYTILEEKPVGTLVGNIRQSTGYDDSTYQFTFMSKDSKIRPFLTIDESSGIITTKTVIDREHADLCAFSNECQFQLEVSTHSPNGFFEIVNVILVIEDINDNSPIFEIPSVDLAISEDVSVGETFALSGARDADTSEQFALRNYEMQSLSPNENLPFSMNFTEGLDGSSKVILTLTRLLDREKKRKYQLYIIAKDGGNPPNNGTMFVNITILDINDNYPAFDSASYNVSVREDVTIGTVILRISATDPDEGSNGRVTYSLSKRQKSEILKTFSIDSSSGNLTVQAKLQYSFGLPNRIIVEASDGSLTNQTFVYVTVLDSENNVPVITIDKLALDGYAKISEYATLGAVVAQVLVKDEDTSPNGDVTCTVSSDGDWFGLQTYVTKQYKVIVDKTLDTERQSVVNVTINCHDYGTPPKRATERFPVWILDENDNRPQFSHQRYIANISEDNDISDRIVTVLATDLDSNTVGNAVISYSVASNSTKYVYVNPTTGVVMANYRFDREAMSNVTLLIYAEDGGSPTLTGTAVIELHILDVNDKKPTFEQSSFRMWVRENMPADTTVGRLVAFDEDEGVNAALTYKLKASDDRVPFVVFSDGLVKTNTELNREFISEYSFEVICSDRGTPSLNTSATVTVFIEDVNDQVPAISFPTPSNNTIRLPYLTSPDTVIGQVVARDADEQGTENSALQYTLTTRNNTIFFSIDANGHVYLTAPVSDPDMISSVFILDVHVHDKGDNSHSVSEVLRILITSQNGTVPTTETDSKHNFFIAVIVASVTIVLSAGIIVTICIIRRFDSRRRRDSKSRDKVLSENLYPMKQNGDVFAVSSLNQEMYNDRKKKEVSFSLDDDNVIDNVAIATNKEHTFGSSRPGNEDGFRSDPLEHVLLEPPPQYNTLGTKKLDDAHSDMSGDSGTGDSGKGGSDDDLQIHNGGGGSASHDMLKPKERWNQRRIKGQGVQPMQTFSRCPQPTAGVSQQKIIPFSFKKPMVHPGNNGNGPRAVTLKNGEPLNMDLPVFYEENGSSNGSSGFLSLDLNYNGGYRGDVSSDVVV